ncbi:hypothetical protein [Marinomonas transparens]|uniref:Uncharacterized protein n=1 Tax=Marinomonas transparens TaxID=2795388 RepID=A0A934JPI2_9GAMM|nr:hypothetical protein [Marinomonas transparens]MBJ7537378.1 hypothetical protein [Marinomonas transparens]
MMRDVQRFSLLPELNLDLKILCDMLSISLDAYSANVALYRRITTCLEQYAFQRISFLYWSLSEQLLFCLEALPQDTGTMNPEAGYIGKAYLAATKAPIEKAPKRMVVVNKQALKRLKKLGAKLDDRQYAMAVNQCLMKIQMMASQDQRYQVRLTG